VERDYLPDDTRELETEPVCFVGYGHPEIENPTENYLSTYQSDDEELNGIGPHCVMKAASLIEQMGKKRPPPRKPDVAAVNESVDRLDQGRPHCLVEKNLLPKLFVFRTRKTFTGGRQLRIIYRIQSIKGMWRFLQTDQQLQSIISREGLHTSHIS
jgi:hypothetical protein